MAIEQAHSRQAAHNQEFVDFLDLDSTPYLDWVVTGAFYTAVHLVEKFLARHDMHPESHKYRCKTMSTIDCLQPVFEDYCDLHTESESCRYLCRMPTRDHVSTSILPKLASIRDTIANL